MPQRRGRAQRRAESVDDAQLAELQIVADRIRTDEQSRKRIAESIEQLFSIGIRRCDALIEADDNDGDVHEIDGKRWVSLPLSRGLLCRGCGQEFAEPVAESLNFQSPPVAQP